MHNADRGKKINLNCLNIGLFEGLYSVLVRSKNFRIFLKN